MFSLSRQQFLKKAASLLLLPTFPKIMVAADPKPPLDPALVKEFVGNAHGNLEKVTSLLAAQPALLNAAWDWGAGDFETGLEAAAHMGRKDIALFLLSKGARLNLFSAAMLGKLDIVKSMLTAFPELKTSTGAHGLSLLHHAKQGGPDAQPVVDYLQSIGLN